MTIANRTVPVALSKLGYQPQEIEAITAYIREHNTVVDAPYICEPHYPIFAVAVGENAISPQGHIDMLAALQPHFSGGLSKTVNVPADTTVQHILDLYMDAWRKGVKCVSVYRDGSKAVQPLNTKRGEKEAQEVLTSILGDDLLRGQRRRVPVERQVVSRHFRIGAVSGYIHVGLFEDGKPGDLFVTVAQAGSALRGMIDAWSTTFSLALQYGAPLEALVSKLAFTSFEPSGLTNDPNLRMAKSIVDYVARWMAGCFLHEIAKQELGFGSTIETASALPASTGEDFTPVVRIQEDPQRIEAVKAPASGDICSQCGSPTLQRTGSCYTCSTCGFNTGCG
jgi:ribonucleoside-diphosphate reductase alpha chain